ncbi:MAG: PP2C family protein-serine/threonine phosphatase, partial [Anaeroplasmataceae bacterium]|nr:PP2C family protein-serine/threonine phosphatase [Anaeroplasmataceae bacterium]
SYIENIKKVTKEQEKLNAELEIATQIQMSMLPNLQEINSNEEFSIAASMTPAKAVGGDFYDFFMIDENHLAIVMADVSGKGIPAALFMMIGKTLLKEYTKTDLDPASIFTKVNQVLCESNKEGLFITAFEGILNLSTGDFYYVNAGHEIPFIAKESSHFKPYPISPEFVLAGWEDTTYATGHIVLNAGDRLFQYTDGVTEASNENNELFGMSRLEAALNDTKALNPKEVLEEVKIRIEGFVGQAPQFDDITMLCLEFKKKREVKSCEKE